MTDFLHYFFGSPSFTIDWLFRAIGGAFGLFFLGMLVFGVLGFFLSIFKSVKNKTILDNLKVALSSIFVISWALVKIAFVLIVISVVLKECRNTGSDGDSYINF